MREKVGHAPLLEEFISVFDSSNLTDITRKFELMEYSDVIDELAKHYWDIKMDMEMADPEKREALMEKPVYKVARFVIEDYAEVIDESVRELLTENYGFHRENIERFDEYNLKDNKLLVEMFFDYLAYKYNPNVPTRFIGKDFERSLGKFKDKKNKGKSMSLLDMILAGRSEEALEHLRAGLLGQAS